MKKVLTQHDLSRFEFLFASSNDAIMGTSLDGRITEWNPAAEKLYGYKLAEILGKPVAQLYPPNKKTEVKKIFRILLAGKKITHFETQRMRKDKRIINVELTLSPIKNTNRRVVGFSAIGRDITSRKRMERALRESEIKYRRFLTMANDAIFVADVQSGIIIDANKKASELMGISVKNLIGKHQSELHPAEEIDRYRKVFQHDARKHKSITGPLYVVHSSGKKIPVEISASTITLNGRKVIQGIFHDIRERQKIDEIKQNFFSVMAHELRTPITTLKLLTHIHHRRLQETGSDSMNEKELELMERELDRLTVLINDILEEQRIEMGKLQLHMKNIDLVLVVEDMVTKMQIATGTHQLIFKRKTLSVPVFADPDRLEQVLINFISNAVKYAPNESPIEVRIYKNLNKAFVAVHDTGGKIPKEKQKVIFEQYYQLHDGQNGVGLGLYIAKTLIEQHKGRVGVVSNVQKGTTFFFSLPLSNSARRS